MTKIFLISLLILLVSCSSVKQGRLLKETPVASAKEARHHIQNKLNFLTMLFAQSRDPYYGTPKWTLDCLKENKIGQLEETKNGIQAISELYLGSDGSPGFCPGSPEATKSSLVYVYCFDQDSLWEIRDDENRGSSTDWCL